jgi:hypothetical protein
MVDWMIYPNALILTFLQEPMDTSFSDYKHEFPSGTLDYMSDFDGLAKLYIAYCEILKRNSMKNIEKQKDIFVKKVLHDL